MKTGLRNALNSPPKGILLTHLRINWRAGGGVIRGDDG